MGKKRYRRKNKRLAKVCILLILLVALLPILQIVKGAFVETNVVLAKEGWELVLVNKDHPIEGKIEPELTTLSNMQKVDSRIYPKLQEMFDAARAQGVYPVVASGYRSTEKQQNLMDEKIEEYINDGYSSFEAKRLAKEWVAEPGTSEHELGLAVDINNVKGKSTNTEVYDWLAKNAHKYGFIYRYPPNKKHITGVINEPWHYRYVGTEAASEIHERGICLEEYLQEP